MPQHPRLVWQMRFNDLEQRLSTQALRANLGIFWHTVFVISDPFESIRWHELTMRFPPTLS